MAPQIQWLMGTAGELFVSLYVLHRPLNFGLRPSWAAGVRSRLPADQREFLERTLTFLPVPLPFLQSLDHKNWSASSALAALDQLLPADRLVTLLRSHETTPELMSTMQAISGRGKGLPKDVNVLRSALAKRRLAKPALALQNLITALSNPVAFGEGLITALQTYHRVFFVEEEPRLLDALEIALAVGQKDAQTTHVIDLLQKLTSGVSFSIPEGVQSVVLAPSYWGSPLTFFSRVSPTTMMVIYGARPQDAPLVPGDQVPSALLNGLKALADPTRLRILHYLSESPLSPADLARKLRLRPPTVIHHLAALRLAGLVEVTILPDGDRRYALRRAGLTSVEMQLVTYLSVETSEQTT
jgi:DNA-binding transcriptional ArsR family regulator